MNKLTPEQYKSVVTHLARLDSEYAVHALESRMEDETFQMIHNAINLIIKSGGDIIVKIGQWFSWKGIEQDMYWNEVWIRGGQKSLGQYNTR